MSDSEYEVYEDEVSYESEGYAEEFPKDERVFHLINQYISLKDDDILKNNIILRMVLDEVIEFLRAKDSFFREFFQKVVFAGSYYKGTKVGNPDEFDLNLVIRLPVEYGCIEFESTMPGFTKIKLHDSSFLPKWNDHRPLLTKWLSGVIGGGSYYLRHDTVRQWMESLFSNFPNSTRHGYQLKRISKSGPAFTLVVFGRDLSIPISVDLVPVLEFQITTSLLKTVRNTTWYAVPKPVEPELSLAEIQWRISFYTVEKSILKQYKNGYMKPVIRQLKKMRDKFHWNFASYYIETIVLEEIRLQSPNTLAWMRSTQLFVHMLRRIMDACESRVIRNYSLPGHNLIGHLPAAQLSNMAGQLARIIKQIKADPLSVANFILTDEELQKVKRQLDCIRNGEEYAPISNTPLKLEDNSSWCSIQ